MDDNIQQYINELTKRLPRNNDPVLMQLWRDKRLHFEGTEGHTDDVDMLSAQLVCAALTMRKSLLIVLPDHAPRRMPLLFATGLAIHAIDFFGSAQNHHVIYFGGSAAIKDYLSRTYIRRERLSDIFSQVHVGRKTTAEGAISNGLPRVVFSYAPSNLEEVTESYNPTWAFLDCGDGDNIAWVHPLLTKLTEKNIFGIACIQNPLSNVLDAFKEHKWNIFSTVSSFPNFADQTEISPFVLKSELAFAQAEILQAASRTMSGSVKLINGRLQKDAWRSVGRYARGLENLLVPIQFFEAESRYYWGIHPIQVLKQTAERFVEAVATEPISKALQEVLIELASVHKLLSENRPPLWSGLEQICIDPPKSEMPTILVFQNRAFRQLFSLAMLAYNDIAEHELQALNVWLATMKQFTQWQLLMERVKRTGSDGDGVPSPLRNCYPGWYPILIGTPTRYNYAGYAHLLRHKQIGVLLLPHQTRLANWHFMRWANSFDEAILGNMAALAELIPNPPPQIRPSVKSIAARRVAISPEEDLQIDDKREAARVRMSRLFEFSPRADELVYLMEEFSAHAEANSVADAGVTENGDYPTSSDVAFVEKVLRVRFRESYEALFGLQDKIQLIVETPGGRDVHERSVRSLRANDAVLFINGQHRLSLYDLIVSRVHDHPTFALHISLIERWQDELVNCFKKSNIPLPLVLSEMQAKGSQLQTETAIRFWLWGQVMCPRDSNDLQRVAEILDMPFVKQYHRQIARAASRMRGLHSSLARRLNTWLEQEALSSNSQSFNAVIDEELGLEFKDFREALMILTVESVFEEDGLFLVSDLGHPRATHWHQIGAITR